MKNRVLIRWLMSLPVFISKVAISSLKMSWNRVFEIFATITLVLYSVLFFRLEITLAVEQNLDKYYESYDGSKQTTLVSDKLVKGELSSQSKKVINRNIDL